MHRINFESKRVRSAILFFTYGVMTVSTIIISALALLYALGYRFDNTSRAIQQGGLLQFVSAPADATVIVDGKQQNFQTPNKLAVQAGRHDVTMKLDGYRQWNKTVDVAAGEIMWLNYARFVPDRITTSSVRDFDSLHVSLASPNRRYIALQPLPNEPKFVIANIRDEDNVTFSDVQLPVASYTQAEGQHNFEMVEWNLDGRFLLIRHTAPNIEEFLRFDRQNPASTLNLSARFGPITKAQFAGNNGNVVFALIRGELRRIPVTATTTELLAAGVNTFLVYRGDVVGFTADRGEQREVGVIKDDRETIVQSYPAGTPLSITVSNYFNHDYMAVTTGKTVDIIRDPADANTAVAKVFKSFTIDQPNAEWLYFSNNGRFLVAQHQGSFTAYDLELNKTYKRTFGSSQTVTRPYRWLDDYNLSVDLDDNLRIVEFDGNNERSITSVATGQTATLSDNSAVIFSLGRNTASKKLQLQRSLIVLQT